MSKRILLAAGGTGGHLFPAFALCEELVGRGVDVHIVSDERVDQFRDQTVASEMHVVPSATLKSRSPWAVAKTSMTLARGVYGARRLLKKIKPDFVLGFGGYPTFPPLIGARLLSIPCGLHDQNAVMGRANRMLAARVNVIATSFEHVKYLPQNLSSKVVMTGNPVRQKVLAVKDVPYPDFEDEFHILIFGGSQGARFFSDFFPDALVGLDPALRSRLSIVQQCRGEDLDRVKDVYARAGIKAHCAAFFDDLPSLMAQAHLIICRSGASSVAELAVCGRPAIMVPLPHALDQDQLLNAQSLVTAGAGWVVSQDELDEKSFAEQITMLFAQPEDLQKRANTAKSLGQPDAVVRLADLVLGST